MRLDSGGRCRSTRRIFSKSSRKGAVVRVSCTLAQVREVLASLETAAIARAGSGVCYAYFTRADAAARWLAAADATRLESVIEFAPDEQRARTRPLADARRRTWR